MSDDLRRKLPQNLRRMTLPKAYNGQMLRDAADEIERLRAKLAHAYDIGYFSTCGECEMPMRPGCICEACGWDRTVSDE